MGSRMALITALKPARTFASDSSFAKPVGLSLKPAAILASSSLWRRVDFVSSSVPVGGVSMFLELNVQSRCRVFDCHGKLPASDDERVGSGRQVEPILPLGIRGCLLPAVLDENRDIDDRRAAAEIGRASCRE